MKRLLLLFIVGFNSIIFASAQDSTNTEIATEQIDNTEDVDLFDLDFEDLLGMEITSVSKKAERLQDVASSIYVVTNEDIIKSGATNLHEVLRTVPGYWGTQFEYNNPSQSMRYSAPDANTVTGTMLFLLDGTPIQDLMGATFSFKNFDIPLDEIDRIEVIRGSGGTVYGANSATGVVNIFTKSPDKYEGINVRAEAATPGYVATSIRAGGKINEKLSVSGYAKFRQFEGFGSLAGKGADGNDLGFDSRFTKDFDKQTNISLGLKAQYKLTEKGKISLSTHYNTLSTIDYSHAYESNYLINGQVLSQQYDDVLYENDVNANRLVGNIRYDHEFNEDHSLFFRTSTNIENNFSGLGGGYNVSNAIYDFEIQDNISLGSMNDLSVGANYRILNYNISDINSPNTINYIDPTNSENLLGGFIQNKTKLFDDKLNLIVGLKAENFSLINDEFYLSPMAKISYSPVDFFTVWGGFTQSYTTPGYNNTNIDYNILQIPTSEDYLAVAPAVTYQQAYQQAIAGGADEATANTIATGAASDPATVQATADGIEQQLAANGTPPTNVGVKNGSNTVPTQFQTWEAGFRLSGENRIMFESNFFYSNISDAIGVGPDNAAVFEQSPTNPESMQLYYLYGNYSKGQTFGTETMLKVKSTDGITFEVAHSWLQSNWQYQKNPDFDVTDENVLPSDERNQTPDVPVVPKHVFRVKTYVDLPAKFNVSLGVIYATTFTTETNYQYNSERYANIFLEDGDGLASPNNSRTIVNIRLEKLLLDDKLSVYAFGNDIFNEGIVANTNRTANVTLSQIAGMYGIGANYKF